MYASATVLFADIVEFTAMCAQSKPMHIVSLLNILFTDFDEIVTKHDAYKVGTQLSNLKKKHVWICLCRWRRLVTRT
jgi:hypothetical protein